MVNREEKDIEIVSDSLLTLIVENLNVIHFFHIGPTCVEYDLNGHVLAVGN